METITMVERTKIGAMIMEAEATTTILRITLLVIVDMATMGMRHI